MQFSFGKRTGNGPETVYGIVQQHLGIMKTNQFDHIQDKHLVLVLSYARISSRKQIKGSGLERQVGTARDWCAANGFTLHEAAEYEDKGLSAYSGANTKVGKLALLQQQLVSGEIPPGSILIVEAFDRLTRQELGTAIGLLSSLISSGLTIVTLTDGRIWDKEAMNDLTSFITSVLLLHRGHNESQQKSKRLRDTFEIQRSKLSAQAFGTAPGWLCRKDKFSPWVVDETKATIVRKVFELSASGLGSKAIAKIASDEGWPVPTRLNRTKGRWHAQMAGQILRNRAVLGELQHRLTSYQAREQHWKGIDVGAPIKNHYPRIVSDEMWLASRASIRTRSVARRRDAHYYNVFSGLMFCGHCGAPIHRKSEKHGYSRGQLNCADRLAGRTTCGTMSAKNLDGPLLQALYERSHESLCDERTRQKGDEIAAIEAAIEENRRQSESIAEAVASTNGRIKAFVNKAVRIEAEFNELSEKLNMLQEEEAVQGDGPFDDAFVRDTLNYLYVSDDDVARDKRALLNVRLTRVVETIWLFGYDCAFIKYKGQDAIQVVPLPGKRLPSRANPASKYHVKPKEWVEPPKPIWEKHLSIGVSLPEPRRPKPTNWRSGTGMVPLHDDDGLETELAASELN